MSNVAWCGFFVYNLYGKACFWSTNFLMVTFQLLNIESIMRSLNQTLSCVLQFKKNNNNVFQGHFMPLVYILTWTLQFCWNCGFPYWWRVIPPFPAILLQRGNWLGFSQEGSRGCICALISPFGGNGSDFSASPGSASEETGRITETIVSDNGLAFVHTRLSKSGVKREKTLIKIPPIVLPLDLQFWFCWHHESLGVVTKYESISLGVISKNLEKCISISDIFL